MNRGVPPRTKITISNLVRRGVPRSYVEYTVEDINDPHKRKLFKEYLTHLDDMLADTTNVCMYGANGAGKTMIASILIKESYRRRYKSYMTTLANLISLNFKADKTQDDYDILNYIKNCDLLIIDEVGKENFNKSLSNIALFEETLRNAVKVGQTIVICSNLPLEGEGGIYEQYGASIESLISGEFIKLRFNENDHRAEVSKKKKSIKLLNRRMSK